MLPIPKHEPNYQWTAALKSKKPDQYGSLSELATFTPAHGYGLDGLAVRELHKKIYPKTTNRNAKSTLQATQCALLALAQCAAFSRKGQVLGFLHQRDTASSKTPARYKLCDFKPRSLTQTLDALAELGFVSYERGFRGDDKTKGISTVWMAQSALIEWLSANDDTLSVISFNPSTEVIVLKDENNKRQDYTDTEDTKRIRASLESSNRLRCDHTWTYMPLDRRYWRENEDTTKKEYYVFMLNDERRVIGNESLICHRIFNGDFKSGGRFYCMAQNLSKSERATIQIDCEPTLELDLKSLHPRLLYHLEGLEAPADCYAAPTKEQREKNKRLAMFVFNSGSEASALKATMLEFKYSKAEADLSLNQFKEQHSALEAHFFGDNWKRLQFLDSQLVDAVLIKGIESGKPLLPIHDSFIAKLDDTLWLKTAIEECYKKITGFEAVIDWD